ncbi:conserved hypothetical protein [Frankia canadensis]|uniref:Uncharacterized protein n=1 Tax=Frankia canadensis TaxID=1836972 RepID=A0A2I2KP58_9ACTN|nr:hypothetical protein [Frankia canadensis]SNQ47457.1 conserved hypothetical protein [Frankia canadensis]SOU54747.1 conserved hypothetical protein [Frankia canadensis]
MDPDPLLTVTQVADRIRLTASSWRARVEEGTAPPPDDPDDERPADRRRPRWRRSTVDAWNAQRRARARAQADDRAP